ncbi:MAG: hypothetical protein IKZ88_08765 [Neisseriaceae bacterium]|nr:hypothetical protein [Neisseriaceae bacterium]
MGFQPTDNAVGVDFMFSGCLKDLFLLIFVAPIRAFGGQECPPYNDTCGVGGGSKTHPTAFLLFFRLPEKGYIYNCGRLKSRPYILNT